LVQRLNTELLQVQMRLLANVVIAMWQWHATTRASTPTANALLNAVLLKLAMIKDHQATLW
jgi:hypothetical protein